MKPGKKRIGTNSSDDLNLNPFAALDMGDLPQADLVTPKKKEVTVKRGRVEVRREKSGRGGKVVTTFKGIAFKERDAVLKDLKTRCATGGTQKDESIELQGDCRDKAIKELEKMGYKPVRAGG